MKIKSFLNVSLAAIMLSCLSSAQAQTLSNTVFSETFTGTAGTPIDSTLWTVVATPTPTLDGSGNVDLAPGAEIQSKAAYSPTDVGAAGNVLMTYSFTTLPAANGPAFFGLTANGITTPWIMYRSDSLGGSFEVNTGATTVDAGASAGASIPTGSNFSLSIYWSTANNEIEFIDGSNLGGTVLATITAAELGGSLPTTPLDLTYVMYGSDHSNVALNSVVVQEGAVESMSVPEPSTFSLFMLMLGLSGLMLWMRRRAIQD
jgi:PEP-CTERM motif